MRIIFNNLQSRAKCTQEERSLIKNGRREGEGDSIFFLRLLIASAIASPRRSSYFLQPSSGFFPPSFRPPYPARYRSFIQLGDTEFALAHSPPPPHQSPQNSRDCNALCYCLYATSAKVTVDTGSLPQIMFCIPHFRCFRLFQITTSNYNCLILTKTICRHKD